MQWISIYAIMTINLHLHFLLFLSWIHDRDLVRYCWDSCIWTLSAKPLPSRMPRDTWLHLLQGVQEENLSSDPCRLIARSAPRRKTREELQEVSQSVSPRKFFLVRIQGTHGQPCASLTCHVTYSFLNGSAVYRDVLPGHKSVTPKHQLRFEQIGLCCPSSHWSPLRLDCAL